VPRNLLYKVRSQRSGYNAKLEDEIIRLSTESSIDHVVLTNTTFLILSIIYIPSKIR